MREYSGSLGYMGWGGCCRPSEEDRIHSQEDVYKEMDRKGNRTRDDICVR